MSALTPWARALLFAGTAAPLFILQGISILGDRLTPAVGLIIGGIALFFIPLLLFPLVRRRLGSTPRELVETKLITPNLGSFLLAYLLPLLSVALSEPAGWAAFFLLVLIIAFVYVRGNLVHVQPAYWIFGWHVYEAKLANGEWCMVLGKSVLKPGEVRMRNLGGHVHVVA